ncbi:MAG: hypothetical protein QM765_13440 [Myxococcales bacterium]
MPNRHATSQHRPSWSVAITVGVACAFLGACRCGEPPPERVWEVGVPLGEVPPAGPGTLVDFVPAGAPLLVSVERPTEVLAQMRADPRLARAFDREVLANLALSDAGATARALRQRLSELSTLNVPDSSLEALLDGPLVLAARAGPGHTDVLLLKRLSPQAKASWQAAQMLQAVSASLREVRVERYRGFPLRKVLVGERRRITYVLLRDLLVAGTSDEWVKASLDLALGGPGERAGTRPAIRAALAEERGAPLFAVVDAEALRSEPGGPGAATVALSQLAWLRASLVPNRGLTLAALPVAPRSPRAATGRPALLGFAPRGTLVAVDRTIGLAEALQALLPEKVTGRAHAEQATSLRDRLVKDLSPQLAGEAFWFVDGLDSPSQEEGRAVARHVAGFTLRDAKAASAALAVLVPELLASPVEIDREGPREITCAAGEALCLSVASDVLLLSNRRAALKAALAVADGHAPALAASPAAAAASDLVYVDAPALAAAIGRDTGLSGDEPLLGLVRAIGPLLASVHPVSSGRLVGEVQAP